jgi:catechol 2,3-dioxygenase-like lactoylglutathione lyase family enzyme
MGIRIGNVVFDAPAGAPAAGVAGLYAELLGMRLLSRGDVYRSHGWPADEGDDLDPLVMDDDPARPDIAFEVVADDDYVAPNWPDPERPAQVHLDVSVPDVDEADDVVRRHGGRLLLDAGDHRVYADVAGHPVCVAAGVRDVARIRRVVFDAFSPRSLATFWRGLLDLDVTVADSPEWVELRSSSWDEAAPALAFRHTVGPSPRWPDPAFPQQLHLDLAPDGDADAGRERALQLGAVRLPYLGGGFVFADPSGHPFCLGE